MYNDYNNPSRPEGNSPSDAAGQRDISQRSPQEGYNASQPSQPSQMPQSPQPPQNQQYPQNNQDGAQNSYGYPADYNRPYQSGQQYPPQPYGSYRQPQFNPPPSHSQPGNGLATASMICGIFSLVTSFTGPFAAVGVILGVSAIITAVCAKKRGFIGGMATAGLTTGIIGTVISALVFISCIACVGALSMAVDEAIAQEWPDQYYDWDYYNDYDWDWNDYI